MDKKLDAIFWILFGLLFATLSCSFELLAVREEMKRFNDKEYVIKVSHETITD